MTRKSNNHGLTGSPGSEGSENVSVCGALARVNVHACASVSCVSPVREHDACVGTSAANVRARMCHACVGMSVADVRVMRAWARLWQMCVSCVSCVRRCARSPGGGEFSAGAAVPEGV